MDILTALFNSYGLVAIGVLLALVLLIWLITHFLTNPGGKVSVLYGLVSYERRNKTNHNLLNESSNLDIQKIEKDKSKQVFIVKVDDILLIDTETQRAGFDLSVYKNGTQLNQLAIVLLTVEFKGNQAAASIQLSLKRKRPGNIISGMPQLLGEVGYQSTVKVTPLGMELSLLKMKSGEKFRLQLVTDGLRATDFYLVQEPQNKLVELKIEKSEDWLP